MNHMELIVKNGTVKIPSIFMFEHFDEVKKFVDNARKQGCVVEFENERLTITPDDDDSNVNYRLLNYASIICDHKVGRAYLRYLADVDKMSWANVEAVQGE